MDIIQSSYVKPGKTIHIKEKGGEIQTIRQFQKDQYLHFSMKAELDSFYSKQDEPVRSTLLALRDIILAHDKDVTSSLKYGMPFFLFRGKMFCYLWIHRKFQKPYIGIVEGIRLNHSDLISEKRSRMKIMLFDQHKDLPIRTIKAILTDTIFLYKSGLVKIK